MNNLGVERDTATDTRGVDFNVDCRAALDLIIEDLNSEVHGEVSCIFHNLNTSDVLKEWEDHIFEM